jgi:hypothetical protein
MMIIDLNLLPPAKKIKLDRLVKFLFTKNLLEFVIIAVAVIAITLLWGWIILIDEFNSLAQSSIEIGRDYSSYNSEVRRVNRVMRSVNESAFGYMAVTPKILEIISSTPANIKINSLDINRADKKIIIYGTALSRNDLLNYREVLKQIPWLETGAMPTTQLLQKENINFEYQTTLKDWPVPRPPETTKPAGR